MTTLSELKKLAKELEHPTVIPTHAWKVSKVKGSPMYQYRLSYGEDYFDFYYVKNSLQDSFGPRTVLSIARYMLIKKSYPDIPSKNISIDMTPILEMVKTSILERMKK